MKDPFEIQWNLTHALLVCRFSSNKSQHHIRNLNKSSPEIEGPIKSSVNPCLILSLQLSKISPVFLVPICKNSSKYFLEKLKCSFYMFQSSISVIFPSPGIKNLFITCLKFLLHTCPTLSIS